MVLIQNTLAIVSWLFAIFFRQKEKGSLVNPVPSSCSQGLEGFTREVPGVALVNISNGSICTGNNDTFIYCERSLYIQPHSPCKHPSCVRLLLKGECMNQKAKPHKPSSVEGLQNGIRVLGLSCFV